MQAAPIAAPETKAAETTGDVAGAFEDFMRTFEAFKAENDDRLAEIERKRASDVLTTEKVDRINRALDEQRRLVDGLVLRNRRPQLGRDGQPLSADTIEHKAAFDAYVRGGAEEALRGMERKALTVAADGGYLVPDETEREIGRRLSAASPIRAIAGVRQVSGNVYKKPFVTAGAVTGWVGEAELAAGNRQADAGRARVPGDGALRHAGGDRDAPRRQRGQHR